MSDYDYTNSSQQQACKVVWWLAARPLQPASLKEVQEGCGFSQDQTFRTLWNLERGGMVEKSGNGRYGISPNFTKAAQAVQRSLHATAARYLGQ